MSDSGHSYTFSMTHEDGTTLSLTGSKVTIDEVLDDFKAWLNGCEYSHELISQIWRDGGDLI